MIKNSDYFRFWSAYVLLYFKLITRMRELTLPHETHYFVAYSNSSFVDLWYYPPVSLAWDSLKQFLEIEIETFHWCKTYTILNQRVPVAPSCYRIQNEDSIVQNFTQYVHDKTGWQLTVRLKNRVSSFLGWSVSTASKHTKKIQKALQITDQTRT